LASRMESMSEPGRINVSAYTYDLVKHAFAGDYRGKIEAKGKGELDMYLIRGPHETG
ncbi:MAG: adenylate/guanylate cyclase domain-containing protein, partial [Verrucomicrobia bacterium]|nr:adenylate/guanylate cyclase domain-containing protein [Verrucomicrobiota bacterium]